jgi:hypothetical protein
VPKEDFPNAPLRRPLALRGRPDVHGLVRSGDY